MATNAYASLSFNEVLEDLSSRFIVNLPAEELSSIERICFQVEQAHWFFEDFLRPLNPSLPSFNLRRFSAYLLHSSALSVPLIQQYISTDKNGLEAAFDEFLRYKTRVPVCGAVLLDQAWEKCLLVKGWKSSASWGFPKGKINQLESERDCAVREVYEETGFDCGHLLPHDSADYMELTMREQKIRLYIVPGVHPDTHFETLTRKEISKIAWFKLTDLPTWKKQKGPATGTSGKFYLISPFVAHMRQWIKENRHSHAAAAGSSTQAALGSAPAAQQSQVPPVAEAAAASAIPTGPKALRVPVDAPKGPRADRNSSSSSTAPTSDGPVGDSSAEGPSSEGLRALLGLGSGSSEAAPPLGLPRIDDGAPAQPPGGTAGLDGVGARAIVEAGDARSRQLLELLRGPPAPSAASRPASEREAPLDERERGTAALLAALNIGAGSTSPAATAPVQPQAQQRAQAHSREPSALLTLLRGGANGAQLQAQHHLPSADSPLPAPRAQSTAHTLNLLSLINPAQSFSVPSANPPGVTLTPQQQLQQPQQQMQQQPQQQTQPAAQSPVSPPADEELERARKRGALLAGLLGPSAPQGSLSPVAPPTDAQARSLLALLGSPAAAPAQPTPAQHQYQQSAQQHPHQPNYGGPPQPNHAPPHAFQQQQPHQPQQQQQMQTPNMLLSMLNPNGGPAPSNGHPHHAHAHAPPPPHFNHAAPPNMQHQQAAQEAMLRERAKDFRFPPPQANGVSPSQPTSPASAQQQHQGGAGLLALLNSNAGQANGNPAVSPVSHAPPPPGINAGPQFSGPIQVPPPWTHGAPPQGYLPFAPPPPGYGPPPPGMLPPNSLPPHLFMQHPPPPHHAAPGGGGGGINMSPLVPHGATMPPPWAMQYQAQQGQGQQRQTPWMGEMQGPR